MRVTNKMMTDQAVYNVSKSLQRVTDLQEKISSGKNINRPSDDPAGMSRAINYRSSLSFLDQYERNIRSGKSWVSMTETALNHANEIVTRAREIALAQSTATASRETRQIGLKEVETLIDQLHLIASTQLGERYIFSGFKTEQSPFDASGTYQGDEGEIKLELSKNDYMTVNLPGNKAFSLSFEGLSQLKSALEENDPKKVSDTLTKLMDGSEQIVQEQAFLGAKVNRLESMGDIFSQARLNLTELLSDTEDTDFVKAITDMNTHQLAYEALLASSGKIMQSTLLDFLR